MKIEDYLHLYIGCDIYSVPQNSEYFIEKMTNVGYDHIEIENEIVQFPIHPEEHKLILRPLSDMTEEEMRELGVLHHWNNVYQNMCRNNKRISKDTKGFRIYSEDRNYDDTRIVFDSLNPNQFTYLLKQSFDLFGLIEAGLAIDRAKVNVINPQTS